MDNKIDFLRNAIRKQFYSRTITQGDKLDIDFGINLTIKEIDRVLWLTFVKGEEEVHTATIPIPYIENGITFISNNGVQRALCNYFVEEEQNELDYYGVIYRIVCGDPTGIIPEHLVKKGAYIQQIVFGFESGYAASVIYNLQRAINEVINRMPLHETNLNSFIMNQRLIIIDPAFDTLTEPNEKLKYQIEKNKRYFDKGWTSIGLSDGVLANKNYILKKDLRKLTPFGLKHHNPQRNLYSTLGMKGDFLPLIRSASTQKLMDKGITRKGWNFFTAFIDIPDVFEDQIMVDESHAAKKINYHRRYQCFGEILVQKGDKLKNGQHLSIIDGKRSVFDTIADSAFVENIEESTTNVGGAMTKVHNIIVSYSRSFRDGTKFTNLHGNKGVIRLKKLGYAINPKTGEHEKIDVIVSGKSVKKRKNFGQILEALLNVVDDENKVKIIDDNVEVQTEKVEARLEKEGYPKDGAWECYTYAGKLKGVCGKVFWGVTKNPQDKVWHNTIKRNGRGIRTTGLKFSTVEFRALTTRFGKDNPIIDEIMAYAQGSEDLHEEVTILRSKRAELPKDKPTVDVANIKPLEQTEGTMFPTEKTKGTIVDEYFHPDGFILKLPVIYQVATDRSGKAVAEGFPQIHTDPDILETFEFDSIYIPSVNLRRCWQHASGKYGMCEIGTLINNIVKLSHQFLAAPEDSVNIKLLYLFIHNYFDRIAAKMGSKRGEISLYGMAVRYPYSSKATATLTNALPKNTVEIHKDMAKELNVKNGDVVLVERFPCLGFMSVRPQKIRVTNDPMCKYTIRASKNSLGSTTLDFDGDDLYIGSFHSAAAKKLLKKEWANPNKCYEVIKELNKKAGAPHIREMVLQDYDITTFPDLTKEEQAVLVGRATGVKSHTGPVIALAYNIMRILENSEIKNSQRMSIATEVFLDKVGNSVFQQKHGTKSLHDIVIDAICMADMNMLVDYGFDKATSTAICNIIKKKALKLGVPDLKSYHLWALENKRSKIINRIVRQENKIYFASRALLEGCDFLHHIDQPVVDLPSKMLKWVMSGKAIGTKTELEKHLDAKHGIASIKNEHIQEACSKLCNVVDAMMTAQKETKNNTFV